MATRKCSPGSVATTVTLGLVVISLACAPSSASQPAASPAAAVQQETYAASREDANTGGQAPVMVGQTGRSDKTLVIGMSSEVKGIGPMNGNQVQWFEDLVVGNLMLQDDLGRWAPALVAEEPRLGTDSWRLLDNQVSETIYKLKRGVKWHDGAEFTAHDLVLYFRVASDRELPYAERPRSISNVEALDDYTVKITWEIWEPQADTLDLRYIWPMPRHILEKEYERGDKQSFANHPYWTTEFVGLGPYKLTRFEPGSHLELTAFDDYALGPPRIKNIVVRFYQDTNVLISAVLAGAVHVTLQEVGLAMSDGILLANQWATSGEGKVLFNPYRFNLLAIQMDPEFQHPAALADVRIRRALLHAMDRQTLVTERFGTYTDVADGWLSPRTPDATYFADGITTRYDYDPARAQQLLADAGWQRGADGMLVDAGGRRFELEYRAQGRDAELTQAVVADYWKRMGIDTQQEVIPSARARDLEWMSKFPGIRSRNQVTQPVGGSIYLYNCEQVPTAQNRWNGINSSRYCTAEMQQLHDAVWNAFPFNARLAPYKEMMGIALRELPYLPLHFESQAVAVRSNVGGLNAIAPKERGRITMWAYTWTMQ